MKKTIRLTENELISLIERVIKEESNTIDSITYSKDQLKSIGMEIQKELNTLLQNIKSKTVKIDEIDYYILSLRMRGIETLSKKDPAIIGEIEVEYSKKPIGSKLRPQIIIAHFKNSDNPMVSNEFTSLFSDSLTGAGGYVSSELQNYLNSAVTKVLSSK